MNAQKDYEAQNFDCATTVVFPNGRTKSCIVRVRPHPPPLNSNSLARQQWESTISVDEEKKRLLLKEVITYPPSDNLEMVLKFAQGGEKVMADTSPMSQFDKDLAADTSLVIRERTGKEREQTPSHPQDFGYQLK